MEDGGLVTGGEDELGSEGLEHDAALERHGLGHGEGEVISLWIRAERQGLHLGGFGASFCVYNTLLLMSINLVCVATFCFEPN